MTFIKGQPSTRKGKHHSEETKKKIKEARARQTFSEETRRKMSTSHKGLLAGSKHPFFGVPRTDEQKKHQSELMSGAKHPMFGKIRPEEHRNNLSNSLKGRKPAFKGRKHSLDSKIKQSECKKGSLNPIYGKDVSNNYGTKISLALKGRIFSDDWKQKISEMAKKRVGDKNSNWNGGTSFEPYCPKFNNQLKERIRERDNHTCQLCGAKENGRKHDCHHIHYDKPNCTPDLITLCFKCNSKVNGNRDYWEAFFMDILSNRGLLL